MVIKRIVKSLFVCLILLTLLNTSKLNAKSVTEPSLIVKGNLIHKDGSAVNDKRIYFFAIFSIKNGSELSAQTTFNDGYISNPSDDTNDNGNFVINIPSNYLKETNSKQYSIGLLRGFGPSFSILRTQEGIAVPINIDVTEIENAKTPVTVNVGSIIIN